MYKLLVTDLDGTILNDEKTISQRDLESIGLLKDKVRFSVFTGRSLASARNYLEILRPNAHVGLHNGAFLLDFETGKTVYQSKLKSDKASTLFEEGKELGLNIMLYSDFFNEKHMILEKKFWDDSYPYYKYFCHNSHHMVFVDDIGEFLKDTDYIVQMVFLGNKHIINDFMKKHENQNDISMVYSTEINETVFFEILGPDVSKGKTLKKMLNFYGIPPEEVIYVGDNFNDLCALDLAGMPVSPANASEEVRRISRFTAPTNNDSPLTEIIRQFFGIKLK